MGKNILQMMVSLMVKCNNLIYVHLTIAYNIQIVI